MRNLSFAALFLFLSIGSANAAPAPNMEELEQRYQRCIHEPGGREYEKGAIPVFWGEAKFMAACAPRHQNVTQAINIYIELGEEGSMKGLYFEPETDAAKCIGSNVRERKFGTPPISDCVLKIRLKFTE